MMYTATEQANQAEKLATMFLKSSMKLATAESCTGGGLAEILTRVSGSSAWFERGFVTYSKESKSELLSVSPDIIAQFGVISEATASAMAKGAVENSRADYGVAITGIAGPDGGTENVPVGTVCFGWYGKNIADNTESIRFDGNRLRIREQACMFAMQGLLTLLKKISA